MNKEININKLLNTISGVGYSIEECKLVESNLNYIIKISSPTCFIFQLTKRINYDNNYLNLLVTNIKRILINAELKYFESEIDRENEIAPIPVINQDNLSRVYLKETPTNSSKGLGNHSGRSILLCFYNKNRSEYSAKGLEFSSIAEIRGYFNIPDTENISVNIIS